MRDGLRNAVFAFGVVSAIVTVWQMVEMAKAKEQGNKEKKLILESLRRIERKLGST